MQPESASHISSRDSNATLRLVAKGLSQLRDLTSQETTPANFAFGAICALIWARESNYALDQSMKGRARRAWKEACLYAQQIANDGKPPKKGSWLGGYFFNDAIIRIDVAFEHTARYATGCHKDEKFKELEKAAKGIGFPVAYLGSWKTIRKEVNRLKHNNVKFIDGPQVSYRSAISCLGDLLKGLQWALKRANNRK